MQNTLRLSSGRKPKKSGKHNPSLVLLRRFAPVITLITLLGAWQLIASLEIYPSFIIPAPIEVFTTFQEVVEDGRLWLHTSATLEAMSAGLAIGLAIGLTLGYIIAKSPLLEKLLSPIIVAFQSTPIVAIAPLLIIWFGSGPTSKVVTTSIIVFFPTLMTTVVGIRNVPPKLRDLMRSLRASRWQIFTKLEIPAAVPVLLAGLKTSTTLAVIGAVVGEFINASKGLGTLVTLARNQYDTPLVFVAILTMTTIALTFYTLLSLLEWQLLAWQRRSSR